ncbi:legume-like lectin family-domain-containing protein [Zopfochytrium polystomum]|nr:legume-like lectin family-domain-containing protein [Zopfochytrium polystomum]
MILKQRNTPYIYAVVNDGSHSFNPNEYLANSIGGCFRDYRNAPHPVWGRLTYANRTLRLDMDLRQDGYAFTFCFEKSGIDLPVGYHFGMSASTSEHHYDDHDMLSLEVFEVNPPPKAGATIEGVLSEETRKKIEQAEREPETMSPHVLQQVLENQFKMIEALNILYDRVGEEPIAAADATHEKTRQSVHQAVSPLHQRLSDLNARLDDLNTKIEENIRLRELAAKLQTVSEDLHGLFGRIKAMNEKGDHALRQVAASLESSKSKLEETHEVIKQTAGSSHYLFYVIFFVAGGILAYAGSVVYRMNSAPKKYI